MQDPMHILLEGSAYWLNWLHLICIVLQCTSLYGSANLTQDCCFAANPCGGVSSRISELVSQGIFSSGNGLFCSSTGPGSAVQTTKAPLVYAF